MGRETEQELPEPNSEEYCQDSLLPRVTEALHESMVIGIEKYGTALQPFNGRDVHRDLFEEWVDLGVYLEQMRRERDSTIELLWESMRAATLTQNLGLARKIQKALVGMGQHIDEPV